MLHFAKLLDLAEPAADEEQEQVEAQRDRPYWERKANPASLGIMDKLISLVPAGTRTPRVTYNQQHVAMGGSGRNFCWFHPRQKARHNLVDLLVGEENRDEWISHMEEAGVSAYKTNGGTSASASRSGIWRTTRSCSKRSWQAARR